MPAPAWTAIQASEEQNQKGFCGHQVQCIERTAANAAEVLSHRGAFCTISLLSPRSCFEVPVMSQFLVRWRIVQLADTQLVLGAEDGKSQALYFSFVQFLLKARKGYYSPDNAYHSMFIPIRSEYAIAIIDGGADF